MPSLSPTLAVASGLRIYGLIGRTAIRFVLHQLLLVRTWYRHHLPRRVRLFAFAIIFVRWLFIVAALGVFLSAFDIQLDWQNAAFIVIVYIFVSMIPLQTIGGFGIGEFSLAWLLSQYGWPPAEATAASLLTRTLINVAHLVGWAIFELILLFVRLRPSASRA